MYFEKIVINYKQIILFHNFMIHRVLLTLILILILINQNIIDILICNDLLYKYYYQSDSTANSANLLRWKVLI